MENEILITGGAGFIGLALAHHLRERGRSVSIIDFPEEIKKKNLESGFICYGYDISETEWIKKVPRHETVIHCAAQSGGRRSLDEPQLDCDWNCKGTVNVCEYCKRVVPKKLVYTSSMAVYGNQNEVTEETETDPISYYGVSKLAGEYYIKMLSNHISIDYTIFRLFATYGPGQDLENMMQGIVSIYYSMAVKDNTVHITGKKDRIRQLLYIDDLCHAIYLSLYNKSYSHETFNVLNEEICTPEKIINTISEVIEKPLKIDEMEGYVGDQTNITGVNHKLQSLGWSPIYNLKQGVRELHRGSQ